MTVNSETMFGRLVERGTKLFGTPKPQDYTQDESPLRAELFSAEQMERYGRLLAASHRLSFKPAGDRLLLRLAENEAVLVDCSRVLTATISANRRLTPAGEWLLDNFYLIDEQIRTAKRHLPRHYSQELPRLLHGPSAGLPRVYDIALETVAHGDGRVDPESLSRFVAAYQTVAPLKLGELWAIPIMLRLALIENLRRIAARIALDRLDQDLAENWVSQMITAANEDPKSLVLLIADMARSNPPMSSAFVSEFTRRLQGQSAALTLPINWIEQTLAESNTTIERLVQTEIQQQAADQVSIGNSIGSLRALSAIDWREFVETLSVVEQTLREDPADVYRTMDFNTRDRYRHRIEKLARHTHYSENDIARLVVELAEAGLKGHNEDSRHTHVGYYLFDRGLARLQQVAEVKLGIRDRLAKLLQQMPLLVYLGVIALLTVGMTYGLVRVAYHSGVHNLWLVLLTLLLLLATSQLAQGLVNWLATLLITPTSLPRLDFSAGIPAHYRTLVVIPTLLSSLKGIDELLEDLEVRFLANQDENLHFALLTDFKDAKQAVTPADNSLLTKAKEGIELLNDKYAAGKADRFFLLHRPRQWNSQEQIWMGYERKRGKLADLNALLRGHTSADTFALIVGNTHCLPEVQYVITLDTDTQLPRDAAYQLVGTIAHPLNRARFDANKQRVVDGYSILQPRVGVSLSGSNRSRYARLHAQDAGLDPYTRAISDVYQDIFAEGSFIGKGIYDVDMFERALKQRLPENRILSHDLLEGSYARAGLITDVQLYENYPVHYSTDVSRRHRWIRGDWQLLDWIFPRVPDFEGKLQPNPLSPLSRWKLFDNLRRSLVAPTLTLLLLLGWTVLSPAWFWTGVVLTILLLPAIMARFVNMLRKPTDLLLRQHLFAETRTAGEQLGQAVLTLTSLPYEAYYSLDAIGRTLWRLLVSHRHLLEWNPSNEAHLQAHKTAKDSWRAMWIAPILASITGVYLLLTAPLPLLAALPILLLWGFSPAIMWWLSQPISHRPIRLSEEQLLFLRKVTRKTWGYFETLLNADDNWLPPDNYQEYGNVGVAHRTSPTNIGLALLANLAAHDFGYLSMGAFLERTGHTLRTLLSLERYHGHFFNWYDTQTLQPLRPQYVSTVDSGNLAGYLLTLHAGLLNLPDQPILGLRWYEGLQDVLNLMREETGDDTPALLQECQLELDYARNNPHLSIVETHQCLERLTKLSETFVRQIDKSAKNLHHWGHILARESRAYLEELRFLLPWLGNNHDKNPHHAAPEGLVTMPTLRELTLLPATNTRALARLETIELLAQQVSELSHMQYDFLFDKNRRLFAIGYNVTERQRDQSYYDLLASEARLSNFLAIAQQQISQESWFSLGRLLVTTEGEPTLLSWSGSMFEYLMPLLIMPTYENTLLDQTYQAVVQRQIEYGRQRGVPWGISESGYNTVDMHLNYQYRAFGVPGLGLKRGLVEDLVVAPYASVLALMVDPDAACQNMQQLAEAGMLGQMGFYEAVDYTPSRQRRGENNVVIQSFMAHHQGMSLLALAYVLLNRPMQKRFMANPLLQATSLLLEERVPRVAALYTQASEVAEILLASSATPLPVRVITTPDTTLPEVQLLSNGRYHVMLTQAGGGYSRYKDMAITRWREDTTCDNWGSFCYIRHLASGAYWSTAYQPTHKRVRHYEAIFTEGRAEYRRSDHGFDTHVDIVISPEDDIELRRVRITNRMRIRRTIDVTSYAEVVLAPAIADALHPAFSNLFVQSEIIDPLQAILCHRRPRASEEHTPWLFHLMAVHETESSGVSYETDRAQFIGRGQTLQSPQALLKSGHLNGSEGAVLDPIVAIRHRITLAPEMSVTLDIVTGIADSREASLALIEKYRDRRIADRVFDLAWTHSQVVLRQLNATESEAQLYAQLANVVIYSHARLRAEPAIIASNHRPQSGLWAHAISGDLPIVLLQIKSSSNIELVRQMVKAHAYWRLKGLMVDLVIWNEDRDIYRQSLQEQILGLIAWGVEAHVLDRPGGIFVRQIEHLSNEDRILIQSVARVIISDTQGTLAEQLSRATPLEVRVPRFKPIQSRFAADIPAGSGLPPRPDLILSNGLGGFTADGREYVITTHTEHKTPAPWVNILANPWFGTVISESGQAYTWCENAHEYRLTPWDNDPVRDTGGEAFYIRDEANGTFWSPTPLPCPGSSEYISRHGFGYSVFEHHENGVYSELTVCVPLDMPVKLFFFRIRNTSEQQRPLSLTGYIEWVLGDLRPKTIPHIITECQTPGSAVIARNLYSMEFAQRVAFFQVDDSSRSMTGDRTEFIGRNGNLQQPAAMYRAGLSGRLGAALDPCTALQVHFELAPGQERELVFTLGSGMNLADANHLIQRYRYRDAAVESLRQTQQYWVKVLSTVQVQTPDQAVNVLTNGWLVYQAFVCRLWGRSGYYQSGGAFGFRDQLQDVMALIHAEPQRVRDHILLSASHQFIEGDVQHWWHPPFDRGVRTMCSDDYLWLPLATCRYVQVTGDLDILRVQVHFLQGRRLNPGEESYYDLPIRSEESASLYDHCIRAIEYGLRFGEHGLPLIGSGDWNDGMNLVGIEGKGESIWLAFFLCEVLKEFTDLATLHGDQTFAARCQHEYQFLQQNIEANGWDGKWYRRAYFDDGTPLGSSQNSECRIDSISQSWAVISGAGSATRTAQAMQEVSKHLIRRDAALVQLLEPPFDKSPLNPGYIKGYVPGVRENGGQYTHAAVWTAMAYARMGDNHTAWELLNMINPVNHARTVDEVHIYKVEPYVLAADVYGVEPHTGRGGWTWYTGSAGWLYRLITESLLGLHRQAERLYLAPCLLPDWQEFRIDYRFGETYYHLTVLQLDAGGKAGIVLDGIEQEEGFIPLHDDHIDHQVEIVVIRTP